MGVFLRLGVIVVLAGCAWYMWAQDPLNPDRRRAAQFCQSAMQDMSPVGKSACGVEIDVERGSHR